VLRDILEFGPRRFRRHAWANSGRGRIEVRGVGDEDGNGAATASAVTAALRRMTGVRWAEVNAVTGHAMVLFDERRVNLSALVETVSEVEDARDSTDGGWSRDEPPHPDDPAALAAAVIGLAADGAGLAAAVINRLLIVPPLPAAARVGIGLIEAQPRLRRLLETALGPAGTDAVVGIGSGVLNGLTGGVGPQLVTGLSHLLLLREVRSRRAVWRSTGCQLEEASASPAQHPPPKSPRPTPFPPGPIELFADRVAAVSLAASGAVFAMTGDLGRTAKLLLIGVPPAARLGREAFAAALARGLAGRGVIPMDPGVFRRLDRIDTILIDEGLLPDAPADADVGPVSAEQVRKLQIEGKAVLVVAGGDNAVLAAADVAVALAVDGEPTGWAADLITDDALAVTTLLEAIPAARRLSRRAVVVSAAGTAAAGIATVLAPWDLGDLTLQPVYLTGLVTQMDGVLTARRLTRAADRGRAPAASPTAAAERPGNFQETVSGRRGTAPTLVE
jgi:copper chaperone CopZ